MFLSSIIKLVKQVVPGNLNGLSKHSKVMQKVHLTDMSKL